MTAMATAQASGPPPKVVPCIPGVKARAASSLHNIAPIGMPPPSGFASVVTSGRMRRDNLLQHIQETGKYFVQQLQSLAQRHACIVDVRGMGLMLGVELSDAELAKQATTQMMERRILINRTDETVLRFLPPYIIEKKHIEQTIHTLDEILTNLTTVAASPAATHGARG